MQPMKEWLGEIYRIAEQEDLDEAEILTNFELLKIYYERGFDPLEAFEFVFS